LAGSEQESQFVDVDDIHIQANEEVIDKSHELEAQAKDGQSEPQEKLIKLPLTRIRSIIKTDPDVKIASQDAVISLAKATELFIQGLAREAAMRTLREKRKIVLRKHLDDVFETKDCYSFMEGVLESFED